MFLFNVIHAGVLEYINNILTNGFVPSLYSDKKENLEIIQLFKKTYLNTSHEVTT